jgi:hypothetical protein
VWAANNTCANALKVVPQKYHGSNRSIGHRKTTKEDITPLTGHMDKLETATGSEGRLVCGRRVVIRELLQGPVSLAGFSKPEKKSCGRAITRLAALHRSAARCGYGALPDNMVARKCRVVSVEEMKARKRSRICLAAC